MRSCFKLICVNLFSQLCLIMIRHLYILQATKSCVLTFRNFLLDFLKLIFFVIFMYQICRRCWECIFWTKSSNETTSFVYDTPSCAFIWSLQEDGDICQSWQSFSRFWYFFKNIEFLFITYHLQRPHKAYPVELAQFHSADYVEFLHRISPNTQHLFADELARCMTE